MYKQITAATIAILAAASAMAHGNHAEVQATCACGSAESAPLTRAEVLADLEVYRQSGLERLNDVDSPGYFSPDYLAAQNRYQALRHSPEFAMRVSRIAHERGEAVATASVGESAIVR